MDTESAAGSEPHGQRGPAGGAPPLPPGALLTRRATIAPRSLDATARTCEAIVATSQPLRRRGPSPTGEPGDWLEVLDLSGCELPAGAPVLRNHDMANPEKLIGVVESSRIEAGQLVARLRFSKRPAVDVVLRDLSAGIGTGVSIGYEVMEWQQR